MDLFLIVFVSFLLKVDIKIRPMIIAGDSINAIIATMCPWRFNCCDSKNETAVTKVTALTDPYAAAIAPESKMFNFLFKIKKVYNGIVTEIPTPNNIDQAISVLKVSCDNSCPPLKPIANNKYKEMNFEEFCGISKSLFKHTATIPSTKKSRAGFVRFSMSKLKFIFNKFG